VIGAEKLAASSLIGGVRHVIMTSLTGLKRQSTNQSINQSSQVMSSQVAFNNKGDTNNEEEKTQYNEEE